MSNQNDEQWLAVIGRSLAFMCLTDAELRDKGIAPQARFLETLGLSRKDVALLLNTSERSITELLSRERRRTKEDRSGKSKA